MTAAPDPAVVAADVRRAIREDIGGGDLTAGLIPAERRMVATVISRETGILCGTPWFDQVFHQVDPGVAITWAARDGERVQPEQEICTVEGAARSLLSAERTALNFLQALSGTATAANGFAAAVTAEGTRILDTRKTLPGLRHAQKYAVRCGGADNHRQGLFDGILIKENHIHAAGSIAAAVAAARKLHPGISVEVETEHLGELDEALAAGADIIMLDNYTLDDMREACRRSAGRARLEASGNVDMDTLQNIAATGVDFISIGAMTKHLRALDLSMRFRTVGG